MNDKKGISKGIILAGGAGTRLFPLTQIVCKQLLPVYDKPMIYYPISTLMLGNVREILIISTPQDTPKFRELLGDGSRWGLSIEYCVQPEPKGIAQAFLLGKEFINDENIALILGDNLIYGDMRFLRTAFSEFEGGAKIFGYYVNDPQRYGVVELDKKGKPVRIEEKPTNPKSNYAIPGIYLYDKSVVETASQLKPSPRGELEITDLNLQYLEKGNLHFEQIGRGIAWLDTGTQASLLEASHFIGTIETRQGLKIACLEEIAYRFGFIGKNEMERAIEETPHSSYKDYLIRILSE
jgi:glucose-1-phosphate thymidylyltransferase